MESTEKIEKNEVPVKLALSVHAFDMVDFDVYFNHLFCVCNWSRKYDLTFVGKRGLGAATARNSMVEQAIELGCTHAFFLDDDHVIPVETLDYLLENKHEAMVSGLVCKRGEGYKQVAFLAKDGKYIEIELPLDGKTYDVGVCAFGCTLINLEKLKKLKKPYFRDTCEIPRNTNESPVNIRSDVNLCNMFREAGERIWIDTRVLVGHLGINEIVYPQNAQILKQFSELSRSSRNMARVSDSCKFIAI